MNPIKSTILLIFLIGYLKDNTKIEKNKEKKKRIRKKEASKVMREEILSSDPDIRLIHNFLEVGEAEHLIDTLHRRLISSKIDEGEGEINTSIRNSTSGVIGKRDDIIIANIEDRIAKYLNSTVDHMEFLQLLNYKKGQFYNYHFDWFTDYNYTINEDRRNQRKHTMILYLNTIPKQYGGGTSFKYLNITVNPIKNNALYFHNLHQNGTGHNMTLHAGDELLSDEVQKWVINSWTRENPRILEK